MAKASKKKKELELEAYSHEDKKRLNNPPVGLVSTQTDKLNGKTRYEHDPHIDPHLSWAGKKEGTSFEVQNVSLHVHERIEPKRIIKSFLAPQPEQRQMTLFDAFQKKEPLHQAVEFYTHPQGWSNRLIAGDSLLVMNSLLQREGMKGKVQCFYFDPPYGISYRSNFQPFVNRNEVKDNSDDDLPTQPETVKAFRDTWELGVHSFLSYLQQRIKLAHELLDDSGSIFIQISDENSHFLRAVLDEIFGARNFVSEITFRKTNRALGSKLIGKVADYILWYAKNKSQMKFRQLYTEKTDTIDDSTSFDWIEEPGGVRRKANSRDIEAFKRGEQTGRFFTPIPLASSGYTESCTFDFEFQGRMISSSTGKSWGTTKEGVDALISQNRLMIQGNTPFWIQYLDELSVIPLDNIWDDTRGELRKIYAVQTATKVVQRCLLMTTDPGDLVVDPTCGSGTTAMMAETWGRRWITCDSSRIAITLAKQRLMTACYDYFVLAHPNEGLRSGFKYKDVPWVTLKGLANKQEARIEPIVDQPLKEPSKVRVCGPFTVEAVPSLRTKPFGDSPCEVIDPNRPSHSGETAKYRQWMDELKITGVRGMGGKRIEFSRIEPSTATRFVHATGELLDDKGINRLAAVCFGPDFGPLEQRQVEQAVTEVRSFRTKPDFLIFCAFQFDPEAAKDIEEIDLSGIRVLKVQMTADLLTADLRKRRSSNESFWLIGQPDIDLNRHKDGRYIVRVNGFDYYNPATGEITSGGADKIAMWMLDTNYDDRSLLPEQVFFPQADDKRDWTRLAKSLNGLVDEDKLEAFVGVESLPFTAGENRKIAVKIIDDRGIESFVIKKI